MAADADVTRYAPAIRSDCTKSESIVVLGIGDGIAEGKQKRVVRFGDGLSQRGKRDHTATTQPAIEMVALWRIQDILMPQAEN
jgi:hypothetical protein